MSTSTVQSPTPINGDGLHRDSHLSESEKPSATLTPTITVLPLSDPKNGLDMDGCAQTFVVHLKSDSRDLEDLKSVTTFPVEQKSNLDESIPCSLEDPVSPSTIDITSTTVGSESDVNDSETVRSPIIDPPGLPRPADNTVCLQSKDEVPPATTTEDTVVVTVQPAERRNPDPLDEIFEIDTSIFKQNLRTFSLSGLSKLDTFIPDDLLPDDLLVHDLDNITNLRPNKGERDVPVRYVRIYPKTARERGESPYAYVDRDPNVPPRVAHLYLQSANRLGTGHHSYVYRAPFKLRLNPESKKWSTVTVAAKTACEECGAHATLDKEARAYKMFPRTLMEDVVKRAENSAGCSAPSATVPEADDPTKRAVCQSDSSSKDVGSLGEPADESAATSDKNVSAPQPCNVDCTTQARELITEPAIVPKFYGYYSVLNEDGTVKSLCHPNCDNDDDCRVSWPTRILLVEECGTPIDPYAFTRARRMQCYKLIKRLHAAGFANGSAYIRNMLVQPGPLSAPYAERSLDTPSFRIIDFGRAAVLQNSNVCGLSKDAFEDYCEDDRYRAMRELFL